MTPSWLLSMLVHLVLLVSLALCTQSVQVKQVMTAMVVSPVRDPMELEELEETHVSPEDALILPDSQSSTDVSEAIMTSGFDLAPAAAALPIGDFEAAAPIDVEFGEATAPKDTLLKEIGAASDSKLSGRTPAGRKQLLKDAGGTAGSERAVALGLRWIAKHQLNDGSWSFDHTRCGCKKCQNPGLLGDARNAATAMAILPFLGSGYTHQEGLYRREVKKGLDFLTRSMQVQDQMGSFYEPTGTMYSHGLASIALCEAYAMTRDEKLLAPAQLSLNYIVYFQDPAGGGWRYFPRMPGDTSIVGWQLMALKSGHMAYLRVPPQTIKKATQFLDSMAAKLRLDLRLHRARRCSVDDRHRPALPDVYGLETRRPRAGPRR